MNIKIINSTYRVILSLICILIFLFNVLIEAVVPQHSARVQQFLSFSIISTNEEARVIGILALRHVSEPLCLVPAVPRCQAKLPCSAVPFGPTGPEENGAVPGAGS